MSLDVANTPAGSVGPQEDPVSPELEGLLLAPPPEASLCGASLLACGWGGGPTWVAVGQGLLLPTPSGH